MGNIGWPNFVMGTSMALPNETSSWFKGMPACSQYLSARLAQPPYLSKRPVLKYPPQLHGSSITGRPFRPSI